MSDIFKPDPDPADPFCDDAEALSRFWDELPESRDELGVSAAMFVAALESACAVESREVVFTTSHGRFECVLRISAHNDNVHRIVRLWWSPQFPVCTTLSRTHAMELKKALKGVKHTLGRYVREDGLLIGDITIPWASEPPTLPPTETVNTSWFFFLNKWMIGTLGHSKTCVLTWDYPEKALRLVTDSEPTGLRLDTTVSSPKHDCESLFSTRDLRLLVQPGKNTTEVFCAVVDDSDQMELTSHFRLPGDEVDVSTTVKGKACDHPRRFVPLPNPFDLFDLDDNDVHLREGIILDSPPLVSDVTGEHLEMAEVTKLSSEIATDNPQRDDFPSDNCNRGAEPAWTNHVWRPWVPELGSNSPGENWTLGDIWDEPERWESKANSTREQLFVLLDCGPSDFLDADPTWAPLRKRVWLTMCQCPNLIWQLVTRFPERFNTMIVEQPWFDSWPDHIWPGAVCSTQKEARVRLPQLIAVPAKTRWILAAPLLEELHLNSWLGKIDQVIVGGERLPCNVVSSGSKPTPINPDWVRSIKLQCLDAKKCLFFVDWGDGYVGREKLVEVLGRKCLVPELHAQAHTAIPDPRECVGPRSASYPSGSMGQGDSDTRKLSSTGDPEHMGDDRPKYCAEPTIPIGQVASALGLSEKPTFANVANVGAHLEADEIGLNGLMELADIGTPDESAPCEELVQHVKLLSTVLGAIEETFSIKMAKLLWRAKRVYSGAQKFEDYAAAQLNCSPRTVYRFIQIGRELTETDYSRIPPPFRTMNYLTIIASSLKRGEDLLDIIESLDDSHEDRVVGESDPAPASAARDEKE